MDALESELEQLGRALRNPEYEDRRKQLYAAQQALAWVIHPDVTLSPLSHLTTHYIGATYTDCSGRSRLVKS